MRAVVSVVVRALYSVCQRIASGLWRGRLMPLQKVMFAQCGKRVLVQPGGRFTFKNVYVGDHVSIGRDATLMCTWARSTSAIMSCSGHMSS